MKRENLEKGNSIACELYRLEKQQKDISKVKKGGNGVHWVLHYNGCSQSMLEELFDPIKNFILEKIQSKIDRLENILKELE